MGTLYQELLDIARENEMPSQAKKHQEKKAENDATREKQATARNLPADPGGTSQVAAPCGNMLTYRAF